VAFQIREAFKNKLIIENKLYTDQKPEKLPSGADGYNFIKFCMAEMLMKFEVRTNKTYTVVGDGSQFLHSVYADANDNDRCKDGQTPGQTGRARENELFRNPTIAFKLSKQASHPVGFGFAVSITTIDKLGLNIGRYTSSSTVYGILPVELRYSPANQKLYVIDTAVRGLVPISLSPFPLNVLNGAYID
jgi:hypothetical protein